MDALRALWSDGFGPIRASDNLTLYHLLLGGAILSLLLCALRAMRGGAAQLLPLPLQLGALLAVWAALGAGASIAALALPPLIWMWLSPLPNQNELGQDYPLIVRLLALPLGPLSPTEQEMPTSAAKYLHHIAFDLAAVYALGTVGLTHALPSPYLSLVVLYALCIAVDGVVVNLFGSGGYKSGVVVAPALLVAGMLGAANAFGGLLANPTLDGAIWLQATTAGAIYVFVQFLVTWTQRNLDRRLSSEPWHRRFGYWLGRVFHVSTKESLARGISQELDATSHRLTGLSVVWFLLASIGLHFLLSDALALSSAVAGAIPLVGTMVTGGVLLTIRQELTHTVREAVPSSHGTVSASDKVLSHPIFHGIHIARRVLFGIVGVALTGYLLTSTVLGLSPLAQSDGETTIEFLDATGTNNLLRSSVGAAHLLANGQFWLEALRVMTSIALVLSAVAAVRFRLAVQQARDRYAKATGEAVPVPVGTVAAAR